MLYKSYSNFSGKFLTLQLNASVKALFHLNCPHWSIHWDHHLSLPVLDLIHWEIHCLQILHRLGGVLGEYSAQARSMVYSLVRVELSMLGIQEQPCELWLQPTKKD